jgi:hypothetical protein
MLQINTRLDFLPTKQHKVLEFQRCSQRKAQNNSGPKRARKDQARRQ